MAKSSPKQKPKPPTKATKATKAHVRRRPARR